MLDISKTKVDILYLFFKSDNKKLCSFNMINRMIIFLTLELNSIRLEELHRGDPFSEKPHKFLIIMKVFKKQKFCIIHALCLTGNTTRIYFCVR